ncbi:MAG: MBL fold metallo-hydrolase [Spartobacteria bacterium]|nr:MBL fold metallo-hydrolase [Spartobacteria bacterium]
MTLRITTLIEDSRGEHLQLTKEHGLSFFIETEGHALLFDTGKSAAFLSNASELGLDLSRTETILLSHGHYDHSGGLRHLIEKVTNRFDLLVSPGFFDPKYGFNGLAYEFLGNNFDQAFLSQHSVSCSYLEEDVRQVVPHVWAIRNFPRRNAVEINNPRFYVDRDGTMEIDDFRDELAMVIETPKGLIVLLGCSHPGLLNMLDRVKSHFQQPIHTIMGGTHLVEADTERLEATAAFLQAEQIHCLGVSHCTGPAGTARLKEIFGERFFYNRTGSSLIVG